MKRLLLALSLVALASPAFAVGQLTIDGSLPRDLTTGKFRMTITVPGITDAELAKGAADRTGNDGLDDRFAIKLPSKSTTAELKTASNLATADLPYFMIQYNDPHKDTVSSPSGTTTTLTYFIEVAETVGGSLKADVGTAGTLNVSVYFYLGSAVNKDPVSKLETFPLKQEVYLINEVPAFDGATPIIGSHQSLHVSWTVKDTVAVKGGDGSPKPPTDVVVYVVPPTFESQTLPAKKFSGAANTADAAATCQYIAPVTPGATTCVTCDTDIYLDRDAIESAHLLKVAVAKNKDGSTTVGGLTNDLTYNVFMQYVPDGLTPSLQCLPGQPSPNFTLTELNGEGDAEIVDFRCFIATAAYGSPLHEDLHYFRKFRSHVLLKSALGRFFVHNYYEYSPPIARFISEHPALRDTVRGFLEVPAGILKSFDEFY